MGSINHLQATSPDTAYLKKIIETGLLADWAIRIEFQSGDSEATCWQLWDKAFYAIRSAEAVLAALIDCYTRHPRSIIRLNAEKFRPQSRVLYVVYNPRLHPAETGFRPPYTGKTQFPREHDHSPAQLGLVS